MPGFGDQREIELLVEAGFSPTQAIQIGTQSGARFLGEEHDIGTVAPGKHADLILVHGDPAAHIEDIEKIEVVFKDGLGYDPRGCSNPCAGRWVSAKRRAPSATSRNRALAPRAAAVDTVSTGNALV